MTAKLVVLDLDETLVHATDRELDRAADLRVVEYHVYLRPHLHRFLDFLFTEFEVGIWTSSGNLYAESLVQALMPTRPVRFVWSSRRCSVTRDMESGVLTTEKRLTKLKKLGFNLDEIIGIDDTPSKYASNYGNLVHVPEYVGQLDDEVLLQLMRYLPLLRDVPSVRAVEKRGWQNMV